MGLEDIVPYGYAVETSTHAIGVGIIELGGQRELEGQRIWLGEGTKNMPAFWGNAPPRRPYDYKGNFELSGHIQVTSLPQEVINDEPIYGKVEVPIRASGLRGFIGMKRKITETQRIGSKRKQIVLSDLVENVRKDEAAVVATWGIPQFTGILDHRKQCFVFYLATGVSNAELLEKKIRENPTILREAGERFFPDLFTGLERAVPGYRSKPHYYIRLTNNGTLNGKLELLASPA